MNGNRPRPLMLLVILPEERHEHVHIEQPDQHASPSISRTSAALMVPPAPELAAARQPPCRWENAFSGKVHPFWNTRYLL